MSTVSTPNEPSSNLQDVYELSPMQQGILFDTLRFPRSQSYIVQARIPLDGRIDGEVWRHAWQTVLERYDVLRTSIHWEGLEQPYQVIERSAIANLPILDWRAVSADRREAEIAAFLRADRAAGFSLAQAPLWRCTLLRLEDERWCMVLTTHHLLLDGWSKAQLLQEVFDEYDARAAGTSARAPRRPPYRDYLDWLRRQNPGRAERHWRRVLAGFDVATPLAIGAAPSIDDDACYEEQTVRLSAEESATFLEEARRQPVTPNVMALGAWLLLLSAYSGESDVLCGAIVASRPAAVEGIEEMLGLLINTLPVRARVTPGRRVSEWLRELQQAQVEARQYDYVSVSDVQRWSEIPSGQALFETLFVFENYPAGAYRERRSASELTIGRGLSVERANVPFTLLVIAGEELALQAVYDARRFDADAVGRLLARYRMLVGSLAADSDRLLAEVPLLVPEESAWLAAASQGPVLAVPLDRGLHDLFAEHAERNPGHPAVLFEGESITYAALDARADRLADALRAFGLDPEFRVAVCLERGFDLVVAFLACLKAGAVYVPLDPAYPRERLAFMLRDAGTAVLLTDPRLRSGLPEVDVPVIEPGAAAPTDRAGHREPAHRESPAAAVPHARAPIAPEQLAYVIYTSGSTGKPKGAANTHGGLMNVAAAQRMFGLTPADRMLQFASASFDASIFEMSMAFSAGATLVLLPSDQARFGTSLIRLLREGEITAATLPPSVVATLPTDGAPAMRVLTVAGEACPADVVSAWAPGRAFWNLYGPTETAIWATVEACATGRVPTIGQPIANMRACVLTDDGQRAPAGVVGELYLAGAGLARGYQGRAALTAARFVPDPFSPEPGARMYRSGDRARVRPDGAIEFAGRVDHQIKLRGFRIEPGEIEEALRMDPLVRDALVAVRDRRLLGYVVPAGSEQPDARALAAGLATTLPAHMVPEAITVLARWPLTPNGKIDRAALPVPATPAARAARPIDPGAATEVERELIRIWTTVLGTPVAGLDDTFFDLGGNSLLLLKMYAALTPRYGAGLAMVDLFRHPTIRALARHLEGGGEASAMAESLERGAQRRVSPTRRPARVRQEART